MSILVFAEINNTLLSIGKLITTAFSLRDAEYSSLRNKTAPGRSLILGRHRCARDFAQFKAH